MPTNPNDSDNDEIKCKMKWKDFEFAKAKGEGRQGMRKKSSVDTAPTTMYATTRPHRPLQYRFAMQKSISCSVLME